MLLPYSMYMYSKIIITYFSKRKVQHFTHQSAVYIINGIILIVLSSRAQATTNPSMKKTR